MTTTQSSPAPLQGLDPENLCSKYGTPLFVYNTKTIKQQVDTYSKAFAGIDHKIMFAVKSCTNISIMKYMKTIGTGLDTVSLPEVKMGLHAGFSPSDMVYTPNVVAFEEIEQAVALNIPVNIENIQNLEAFGKAYKDRVPVCIRLNPNMMDKQSTAPSSAIDFSSVNKEHYDKVSPDQVKAWQTQSKFGIAISQLDQVMRLVKEYGIRINGIHLHSSHVILNRDVFAQGARTLFDIASRFDHIEYVDFGGGVMVPHHPDDQVVNLEELGRILKKEYDRFCQSYGKKIKILFEPGRFLISDAGVLLTRAVVLKSNGVIDFAGTDTGFNHMIRPMMYDAYHEIVNVSNPNGDCQTYNVVGNLCEIDNLATCRLLSRIRPGDILMIKNAGAYGFSMSSNYNSKFRPAEVLIHQEKPHLIRKRETYEDLVRNMVEIDF